MDVQEPEDQFEEAQEETPGEPTAPAEVASRQDPSTGSPSGDFAGQSPEPESRSGSSIPADASAGESASDAQESEDQAEQESEAAEETDAQVEVASISAGVPSSGAMLQAQEPEEQFEQEPEEVEASEEPAAHVEVAPIRDPEPAAPSESEPPSDLTAGDGTVEGPAWYVVHCYSGYENKVRHNLEQRIETMGMKDKIFDVVIPTQEEIEVKEGKRRTVERHIFPGYVLVNMALSEESWYVVRNTPGVTGFVGMGNQPTPLRPEEVSQIIKRMEAEAPTVKVTFKVGERVRIVDGPFNDFRGVVAEIDMERTKVRVMVSFFGRETPVELDFLQVEKA